MTNLEHIATCSNVNCQKEYGVYIRATEQREADAQMAAYDAEMLAQSVAHVRQLKADRKAIKNRRREGNLVMRGLSNVKKSKK